MTLQVFGTALGVVSPIATAAGHALIWVNAVVGFPSGLNIWRYHAFRSTYTRISQVHPVKALVGRVWIVETLECVSMVVRDVH